MKSFILTLVTMFAFAAQATIPYSGASLSAPLNEYGSAHSVDENSTAHNMMAVIFPDANGHSGIAASKFMSGVTSQVTGRQGPALYKSSGGALIPVVELVSMNTSTDLPMPLTIPSSALSKVAKIVCTAGAGGAATAALTCTGLLSTDTVLAVTQNTPGANSLPLLGWSTLVANGITAIWSADPGAGAVVQVAVLHQ